MARDDDTGRATEYADDEARASPYTRAMLACGVVYTTGYIVVNDGIAAARYPGYDRMSQAISELSATAAPTQRLLTATLPVFAVLMVAFGAGVFRAARGRRSLRALGILFALFGALSPLWLFFPMTSREAMVAGTMPANDAGHIGMTIWTVGAIITTTVLGAVGIRRTWFSIYSAATLIAVILFGALTGVDAAKVPLGEPTPLMGLYERINAYGWMVWLAVVAIVLIVDTRRTPSASSADAERT